MIGSLARGIAPSLSLTVACLGLVQANVAAAQCSSSEFAAIQEIQQRAFAAGASLDINRMAAVARESQSLYDQLSPGCRSVLNTSGAGYSGYAAPSTMPSQPPSVYYSPGTDTYHAPDAGISCGPQGCY